MASDGAFVRSLEATFGQPSPESDSVADGASPADSLEPDFPADPARPSAEHPRLVDFSAWAEAPLEDAAQFVANPAREEQEKAWAAANVDARQMLAVREALGVYSKELNTAIVDFHRVRTFMAGCVSGNGQQPSAALPWWLVPDIASRILGFEGGRGHVALFVAGWRRAAPRRHGLTVCLRKRPLLAFELERGERDSVEVSSSSASLVCHDGRLTRSGRALTIAHKRFAVDHAWDAKAPTDRVYTDVVEPLARAALEGRGGTLLCMGQTGTGKTFTTCGVVDLLAKQLRGCEVEVECFEIYGKKCCDLLANRKEVHLLSDASDAVHVKGICTVTLPGAEGLQDLLQQALTLRASEETERNSASSRSHAIFRVRLTSGSGELRLVDLAGSERNYETTRMTAQQHRDSVEINASLSALKHCFWAHAASQRGEDVRMPFRQSRLTRVLKHCFTDLEHKTVVIATVSPAAGDVIHTVNTLNHATMLALELKELAMEATVDIPLHLGGQGIHKGVPVAEWSPEQVHAWLMEAESGRFSHLVVPPDLDGKRLMAEGPEGLNNLFERTLREGRGRGEGEAWNVGAARVGQTLGRELFAAARRVAMEQDKSRSEQAQFSWFGRRERAEADALRGR